MVISTSKDYGIEVKTKQTTAELGKVLRIGNLVIDGPGEYDVAGIAIHGFEGKAQTVFLVTIEDVRIVIVPQKPEVLSGEVIDQIGGVDIAVVPVVAESPVSETIALVNSLDPLLVIPIGTGNKEEFIRDSGETTEPQDSFKVIRSSLPLEGRQTVLLT